MYTSTFALVFCNFLLKYVKFRISALKTKKTSAFCSVINCGMRSERDKVSFYRFPAILTKSGEKNNELSKRRRDAWIKALKRGPLAETQLKNGRVCFRHFISGNIYICSNL